MLTRAFEEEDFLSIVERDFEGKSKREKLIFRTIATSL
jgi:hypothetical protein